MVPVTVLAVAFGILGAAAILSACSSSSSGGNQSAEGGASDSGPMDAGSMCGTSGVFSIRMVNNTYPCQDNESASFNAGPGDSAYGVYTSASFFFADCAFTSATSACPAHATFTCGPSSGIGDAAGLATSATIEIDIESNNTVSGTVTIVDTMGVSCTDTFTGSRDPDAMGL